MLHAQMNERRTLRGVVLAGAAGIGVLAGHWFAYVLAYPATSIRAEILASSGHGYWLWAVRCAAVLLVRAIGALVASVRAHARPMRVEARPVPLPAGLVPVPAPLLLAGAAGLRGPPLLSS